MKAILEAMKANKGKIIKRGLIAIGAVAGLTILGGTLIKRDDEDDLDDVCINAEDDEDSDEQ